MNKIGIRRIQIQEGKMKNRELKISIKQKKRGSTRNHNICVN